MDQAALVDVDIEGGAELVAQLGHGNFDVKVAYWLYTSEADQWFLYLVSDEVNRMGIAEAYKGVYKAMRTMRDLRINRFEVKLVGPDDPVARAIMDFSSRLHAPLPTWVRGSTLGDLHVENAYIYPPMMPRAAHPGEPGGIGTELGQAATPGPVQ
jgi:hypothetical protein